MIISKVEEMFHFCFDNSLRKVGILGHASTKVNVFHLLWFILGHASAKVNVFHLLWFILRHASTKVNVFHLLWFILGHASI